MPRLPSSRLRSQTQQASVRRGPRASARAPCLGYLASRRRSKHGCASHGCANRRSKHLFAEGPVPRLPSFSRLRSQTRKHLFARRSKQHLFAEVPVPRLPLFPRLRLADAASTCSPRAPCLGYLASHGFARSIQSGRFLPKSRLRQS